jgi:threonine synthase
MYFAKSFPAEFEISPDPDLINTPVYVHPKDLAKVPAPGKPLQGADFKQFVERVSEEIAKSLSLKKVQKV